MSQDFLTSDEISSKIYSVETVLFRIHVPTTEVKQACKGSDTRYEMGGNRADNEKMATEEPNRSEKC